MRNWQIQRTEPKVMDKYELKMHESIKGVITALPRATPQERRQGIDHHLHITGRNIKLRAKKMLRNDKLLTVEPHTADLALFSFCSFNLSVIL